MAGRLVGRQACYHVAQQTHNSRLGKAPAAPHSRGSTAASRPVKLSDSRRGSRASSGKKGPPATAGCVPSGLLGLFEPSSLPRMIGVLSLELLWSEQSLQRKARERQGRSKQGRGREGAVPEQGLGAWELS